MHSNQGENLLQSNQPIDSFAGNTGKVLDPKNYNLKKTF